MKERWISIIIALLFSLSACERQKTTDPGPAKQMATSATIHIPDKRVSNPFPNATELRLFVETDYSEHGEPIFSRPGGRTLNAHQRREFERALFLSMPPDEVVGCFIPHHFFRYYDREGKQVAEVQVCFCCEGVQASGNGNFQASPGQILEADYDQIERVVSSAGEPTNVLCA